MSKYQISRLNPFPHEGSPCVKWWVDVDALNFPGKLLFKSPESKQVVAEDKPVIENVVIGDSVRCVVGLLRVLQQDSRLQLRPVLFTDPGEFKFRFLGHLLFRCCACLFRVQSKVFNNL